MSPTAFEFTLTMPGDARLVGAVRLLAVQAAGYAQWPTQSGEGLAAVVENATEAAIASTQVHDAPIQFWFAGDETGITVKISCEPAATAQRPRSTTAEDVSVEWSSDGSHHTCHIRQRIPS